MADSLEWLGWKCCKPRVLTFDEFLTIPPCTTGKHSTVDDTPPEEAPKPDTSKIATLAENLDEKGPPPTQPIAPTVAVPPPSTPAPPPEPDSDDPSLAIPANATCRRKGCNATFDPDISRDNETCTHHPGQPVFHEGSKGWSCCKRRVLEFDEFMKIAGCTEKKRHLFVGKGKAAGEEKINDVRWVSCVSVLFSFWGMISTDNKSSTETISTRLQRLSMCLYTWRKSTRKRPRSLLAPTRLTLIYPQLTISGLRRHTAFLERSIRRLHSTQSLEPN